MPSRDFATCSGGEPVDVGGVCEREVALDRLDLARRAVELAGDRDVERPAAPVERRARTRSGARSRRRSSCGRGRSRPRRAPRTFVALGRRLERAQQRERLEVDPDDLQARPATRLQVAIDDLAVGDDEEDALPLGPVLAHLLVEDDVVEHGLVERDREDLLGAEADRVLELLRVRDAVDLEDAHADAVVGDAEPDAPLRKLVQLEEALERVAERIRVADLARDDEAGLERLAEDLDQLGSAVVHDLRGGELRGTDLETDELLRALVLPLVCRARLLVAISPPAEPALLGRRLLVHQRSTGPDRRDPTPLLDGEHLGWLRVSTTSCWSNPVWRTDSGSAQPVAVGGEAVDDVGVDRRAGTSSPTGSSS